MDINAAARPLNVKDALSYLDRVKVTFSNQEEVYGRFLTIMKDFKTQGIDTPGVIDRVSTLFRGHPALIQGFNTFLPPGYRIECTVSTPVGQGTPVTTITVTTPMGNTTKTQIMPSESSAAELSSAPPVVVNHVVNQLRVMKEPEESIPTSTRPEGLKLAPIAPVTLASITNSVPAIATPGAATLLSSHMASSDPSAASDSQAARPPMEFNHAINYVNKIKNRFVRDPDTYKSFLEILQTYQKEGRAIQDVYAQVTTLFHTAPDLLDEFKQFLPDTSADVNNPPPVATPSTSANSVGMMAARAASGAPKLPSGSSVKRDDGSAKKVRQSQSKANKPEEKLKSKRSTKDSRKAQGLPDPYGDLNGGAEQYSRRSQNNNNNNNNTSYQGNTTATTSQVISPAYAYEPPPLPPPPQPIFARQATPTSYDRAFFNRVQTYIGDTATYHEFLKLLNLYSQDILDLTALVSRAFLFLGQDLPLWKDFKHIVGWSDNRAVGDMGARIEIVDGVRIVENVPSLDGPRRGKGDSGKDWKTYGPSYRQLPSSEISMNCSGRDALCWDVLNDEWISQPSWASDEGFVAQRKNPYEEALHRSEEDRHEYDYHIEANLRTIALLEPIATRIAIMEGDERATFRLKAGLGNQSKSIYQRVIKKVYGKEQGGEVIQALHENPCVAVPIVLARLKQKDDEWKKALREWNRVWRDVDAKNFWRSLDHQAIALKLNDKKTLTAKAMVTEIETIKLQQRQRTLGGPLSVPFPRAQLVYDMSDPGVLSDAVKLVFSFLDRTPGTSSADKDRIDAFLRQLLPLTFAMDSNHWNSVVGALNEGDGDSADGTSDVGTGSVDDSMEGVSVTAKRAAPKKVAEADLRKKALKNAIGPPARAARRFEGRRSKASSPAPSSRGTSPALSATQDSDIVMSESEALESVASPLINEASLPEAEVSPLPIDPSLDTSTRSSSQDPDSPSIQEATLPETLNAEESIPVPASPTASEDVAMEVATEDLAVAPMPELITPVDDHKHELVHREQWNLFANSSIYSLLRVLQLLYGRLLVLKASAKTLVNPPTPQSITEQHVPSLSLASTLAISYISPSYPPSHYYQRALGLCEQLFDGETDQATFEEAMRQMFGTHAHVLFTVDKVCNSIVKLSHTSLVDSRTTELLDLLTQDRSDSDRSTPQQQTFYRTQAESAIGTDENMYRIAWASSAQTLSFQLLGKDSLSATDIITAEKEWAIYVDNFVLSDATSDAPNQPYLRRNLRKATAHYPEGVPYPENVSMRSSLQCKICIRSYRLFFVPLTEDFIYRESAQPEPSATAASRFDAWLDARLDQGKEVAQTIEVVAAV